MQDEAGRETALPDEEKRREPGSSCDVWDKRSASSDESDESIDRMDGSGFQREGKLGFCKYDESSCICNYKVTPHLHHGN
ncbi:unnamed protein product, partial [Ectocarpus sp. 12 AP-2014]